MNAAVMIETCPEEETLAAFSDGTLDAKRRREVMQHIADCGQCQHDLMELDAARRTLKLETGKVRWGAFGPRVIVPLAAAAAVLLMLFGVPAVRERILPKSSMAKLVEAANGLPERTTSARLSGNFAYKGHRTYRSGKKHNPELVIQIAVAEVAQRAEKNPSAENLHADGVGRILLKENADAVLILERAAQANPQSGAILTDLSVAYLNRGDYAKALDAATKAEEIQRTPAALWNRALALEGLRRNKDAIAAWRKYLELDPNSPWSQEVREAHLDRQLD
jgi:tetratricopeptide (TPR) repeat protein